MTRMTVIIHKNARGGVLGATPLSIIVAMSGCGKRYFCGVTVILVHVAVKVGISRRTAQLPPVLLLYSTCTKSAAVSKCAHHTLITHLSFYNDGISTTYVTIIIRFQNKEHFLYSSKVFFQHLVVVRRLWGFRCWNLYEFVLSGISNGSMSQSLIGRQC